MRGWLLAALAAAAVQATDLGGWFDGAGASPQVPGAEELRERRFGPTELEESREAEPPAVPSDLQGAAARWANAVQASRLAPAAPGETVRIAVIGDAEPGRFAWERVFSPGKDAYARQIKAIHALAPRAVVQLGDFVSHGTADNYRAHVAFLDAQVTLPYLSVAGNHDRSSPNGTADKLLYRAVFGSGDAFADIGDWRLILLDSSDRRVTAEQLRWLEARLQGGKRSLIFTHVPPDFLKGKLAAKGIEDFQEKEPYRPFKAYFTEGSVEFGVLAARYRVERVYVGHIHAFGHARHRGVAYVLTGGGGSPLYPLPPNYPRSKFAHFIEAELSPSGVRETVHRLDGGSFELDP